MKVQPPRSGNPPLQVACLKTCRLRVLNLVREYRCALYFFFITDINVIVAKSTGGAQVEDPVVSIGVDDSAV